MEVARVVTDARDSFESIKQEMEAIKSISEMELTVMKDAVRNVENDIRNTAASAAGMTFPAMTIGSQWAGSK